MAMTCPARSKRAAWSVSAAAIAVVSFGAGAAVSQEPPTPRLLEPALADQRADARETMESANASIVYIKLAPGVEAVVRAGRLRVAGMGAGRAAAEANAALARVGVCSTQRVFADGLGANAELARRLGLDRWIRVTLADARQRDALIQLSAAHAAVLAHAEAPSVGGWMEREPNDPEAPVQYALENVGQEILGEPGLPGADIRAFEAWGLTTGSDEIVIAVLDSGVSTSHPELAPKLVEGRNFADGDPEDTDDSFFHSHGTHCAGVAAAASNNEAGVSGVCWDARIMPIRVLNALGWGAPAETAQGLVWATDEGASIASISLGWTDPSALLHDAVRYARAEGVVLVAATGNASFQEIKYPARYPEVIAVAATNNRDETPQWVTVGPETTIAAPGVNVRSTWDTYLTPDGFSYATGTSQATPIVAGVAGLIRSVFPDATPEQVEALLIAGADDLGPEGWDEETGAGRVNAFESVRRAVAEGGQCDADWNGDGLVNAADVGDYLSVYMLDQLNGTANADLDGNGLSNPADVGVFLTWYFHEVALGCDTD